MRKLSVFFGAVVFVFGVVGNLNAALIDRGGGLIYDSDQNITWLQNANYSATELTDARRDEIISAVGSSIDSHVLVASDFLKTGGGEYTGRMTWWGAVAWADQLVYGGYDDWRLPATVEGLGGLGYDGTTTEGFNNISSDMGYMYYENLENLGTYDTSGNNQDGAGLVNYGPFSELRASPYWSSTEHSNLTGAVWGFNFFGGYQDDYWKSTYSQYAWAVRDGDVSAVPIPGAAWLLGSGLIGFVGFMRKYKK